MRYITDIMIVTAASASVISINIAVKYLCKRYFKRVAEKKKGGKCEAESVNNTK